jgi:hypothetical protein
LCHATALLTEYFVSGREKIMALSDFKEMAFYSLKGRRILSRMVSKLIDIFDSGILITS